jgi:uncharacterized membrane protein YcaP (DUF421 family)
MIITTCNVVYKYRLFVNSITGGKHMLTILIRIIIIYTILIGTMRVMGKRQIGELQVSELVTTLLLSELAAQPVADSTIPLFFAIIPIGTLISLEVIISLAVMKIPFLKRVFDGRPSILILKGKLDLNEIQRIRLSLEELLSQLRIAGISDINDVEYAILEHNGQLSVIPKKNRSQPSFDDLGLKTEENGIAHAVIVDSKIKDFDLKLINKNRSWLNDRLSHHKVRLEEVVLFTVDDAGKENLILR